MLAQMFPLQFWFGSQTMGCSCLGSGCKIPVGLALADKTDSDWMSLNKELAHPPEALLEVNGSQ